jgi:FRG domain
MTQNTNWNEKIVQGCLTEELASWEDFVAFVKDEKRCWPTLIFRGQANYQWKLYSRLDRLELKYNTKPNRYGESPAEFRCTRVDRDIHLKRFRELALDKITKTIKDDNVLWTIAQHHGLATHLLDFTYSPFVALFFAFEEEKCWCTENGKDVFKCPDKRAIFAVTHHIIGTSGEVDKDKSLAIKELTVPFTAPGCGNYRATSQAGVFLNMLKKDYPEKWDLESYVREKQSKETYKAPPATDANPHPQLYLQKLIIPNNDRIACLRFLDKMNINRATLFPDLDGIAKYVNDLWEVDFDKASGYIEQAE